MTVRRLRSGDFRVLLPSLRQAQTDPSLRKRLCWNRERVDSVGTLVRRATRGEEGIGGFWNSACKDASIFEGLAWLSACTGVWRRWGVNVLKLRAMQRLGHGSIESVMGHGGRHSFFDWKKTIKDEAFTPVHGLGWKRREVDQRSRKECHQLSLEMAIRDGKSSYPALFEASLGFDIEKRCPQVIGAWLCLAPKRELEIRHYGRLEKTVVVRHNGEELKLARDSVEPCDIEGVSLNGMPDLFRGFRYRASVPLAPKQTSFLSISHRSAAGVTRRGAFLHRIGPKPLLR